MNGGEGGMVLLGVSVVNKSFHRRKTKRLERKKKVVFNTHTRREPVGPLSIRMDSSDHSDHKTLRHVL